jgi:hypothetical protein
MTFEEFFKKKKIDLEQFKTAEPALFTEFEAHYAVMGEKSFDHTKKYWFNELRRKYHTPEEVKPEKVTIENPIAEQTVIESITEEVDKTPVPKLGFKPKFKAPPSVVAENAETAVPDTVNEETAGETSVTPPNLGFKPKFKTQVHKSPPGEGVAPTDEKVSETPEPQPAPKLGFKPKFKAGVTNAAPITPPAEEAPKSEEPVESVAPKLGFKPKFKAGITKPAASAPPVTEETKSEETKVEEPKPEPTPKLGFKPKFKAQNIKPKTEGE